VGIAAQLPSGDYSPEDLDYSAIWNFLLDKGQAYQHLSHLAIDPNPYVFNEASSKFRLPKRGAFLKKMAEFDNISFGISARDARVMPFAARRLMELSFLAMVDSGIRYRGTNAGCFMSGNNDLEHQVWFLLVIFAQDALDAEGGFAYPPSAIANRISYALNITGPSILLDTACSSSLSAMHLAISAIEKGDCATAIVGACQSNRRLTDWTNYSQGGVLSPDGLSKPFAANADGFARGEGAVVVVIKPVEDALRDNDHIYGVILGSSINSTGSASPLNVPNGIALQQNIRSAYQKACRNPADVDYVELHATGTSVGDPIEVNAAGAVFEGDGELPLGSVKGNIGHLESVAFLASLIKACLIFENGIIPPHVNCVELNANVPWSKYRFRVPAEATPLGCRSPLGRSLISISSAGIGGAAGHIVLEAPPKRPDDPRSQPNTPQSPVLCVVGGLTPKAVEDMVERIATATAHNLDLLTDYATVASRRARQFQWRTYVELPLSSPATTWKISQVPTSPPSLAFIFSGQGPQHFNMGRQLFSKFTVFRDTILALDRVHDRVTGISLVDSTGIFADENSRARQPITDWPVSLALPALAMLQIALFDLLASVRVSPAFLIGHSAGETAVLYASGAGPKEMAMEIAIARGRIMTRTEKFGSGMAAVSCGPDQAEELIREIRKENTNDMLGLACINSPTSVALYGSGVLLERVISMAKEKGYLAQRIQTRIPAHSPWMESCRDDFNVAMADIFSRYGGPHRPRIPVYSTCNSPSIVNEFTAEYFWDNLRNVVRFSDAISSLLALPTLSASLVFVEISPHPVLASSVMSQGVVENAIVCPMHRPSLKPHSARGNKSELSTFLDALGQLSILGVHSLDLTGLYGHPKGGIMSIRHPLTARTILPNKTYEATGLPPSKTPLSSPQLRLTTKTRDTLAQHVIGGEPILPAAGFIEVLVEAGANYLWDVEFISILPVVDPMNATLNRTGPVSWSVNSSSGASSRTGSKMTYDRENARGCMDIHPPSVLPPSLQLQQIWERLLPLSMEDYYLSLRPFATFGPSFQRVLRCSGGPSEVIAEIKGLTQDEMSDGYILHPALLDASIHIMLHADICRDEDAVYHLPSRLGQFVLYHREVVPGNWFSHIRLQSWSPDCRVYDITITNSSGERLCDLFSLALQKHVFTPSPKIQRRYDLIFQPVSLQSFVPAPPVSFTRQNYNDARELYLILDSIALRTIASTLGEKPVVGNEVRTGLFTSYLTDMLERQDDMIAEYTVTDISRALAIALAEKSTYPWIVPNAYDLSKSPAEQGFSLGSYDVIVALHTLHVVPDLKASLMDIRSLLVPGGCLLIVDLDGNSWTKTPGSLWHDFWTNVLEHSGFVNVHSCVENGGGIDFFFSAQLPFDAKSASVDQLSNGDEDRIVIPYRCGQEVELQARLRQLDPLHPHAVYLLTTKGPDADAAMGLILTLNAEFEAWLVRLAIFESEAQFSNYKELKIYKGGDDITSFTRDGRLHVPRVVPISPPCSAVSRSRTHESLHPHHLSLNEEHIVVHVLARSPIPPFEGFLGKVVDSRHASILPGQLVAGVMKTSKTSLVAIHAGCVTKLPEQQPNLYHPGQLLGIILGSLVLGPSRITFPGSVHPPLRVLVALSSKELADSVTLYLQTCSLHVETTIFSNSPHPEHFNIVLTDSSTTAQYPILRRWLHRTGKLLEWDHLLQKYIAEDPWMIRYALESGLGLATPVAPNTEMESISGAFNSEQLPSLPLADVPSTRPLFDPTKAYVLLGGIGGLGIHLAVWLYQNGAKNIILTSRRGLASIDPSSGDHKKLEYLRRQEDLNLRAEPCDATSVSAITSLFQSISLHIGGCFLMPLVLSDALFVHQTEQSFRSVRASKIGCVEALAAALDIQKLDFLVGFSSITGLVGNVGQANYSSACTSMDGSLQRYPNAFSLIVPPISNAGLLAREEVDHTSREALRQWGISVEALCRCIEDGLMKLQDKAEPFSRYIPELNWGVIETVLRVPASCRHLVPRTSRFSPPPNKMINSVRSPREEALDVALSLLDVAREEFDPELPLVTYGLDSVGAARLATSLRPFVTVSQMQLLDLRKRALSDAALDIPSANATHDQLSPRPLTNGAVHIKDNVAGPTLEKLVDHGGVPLVLIHGASGDILSFVPLMQTLKSSLWALQITEEVPLDSVHSIARFYFEQIKAARAHGPYRLGAFSGTSVVLFVLAKLFEDNGDEISQLAIIDHFPLLFTSAACQLDVESVQQRSLTMAMTNRIIKTFIVPLYVIDSHAYQRVAGELSAAIDGQPASSFITKMLHNFERFMTITYEFMFELLPPGQPYSNSAARQAMIDWLAPLKAPVTTILATEGVLKTLADWDDAGTRQAFPNGRVVKVVANHFSVFESRELSDALQ
ncbi:hypothetical protein BJ138DRAFT_1222020, partial [Hygrophoropsis aurantiaca]